MSVIETIRDEHAWIEQEIIEIETILESEMINYPNLIHVLKELSAFWDEHVRKEHAIFTTLEQRGVKTPLNTLLREQALIIRYRQALFSAIASGSEHKTRVALQEEGQMFISALRKHMQEQEWVFYALPELEVETFLTVSNDDNKMIVGRR